VGDHPEDPVGEAMTAADAFLIGLPGLAGVLILIHFLDGVIRSGAIRRHAMTIARWHVTANRAMIDKGILRFPGIHLVTSPKAWIGGELLFLATAGLVLSRDLSLIHVILALLLGAVLGGAALYLALREEAGRQIDAIRSALPVASFLLSLMLEAGMGSAAALQEVVAALPPGPLSGELGEIALSRRMGASRAESIERSRRRIPLDDYRTFLNLIEQGERLGIALSQGLRELSSRIMESQGHRAETLAQKAAVKLLFPLVIFIFPSVFLVILSPVILNLWELLGR
jgi:pilus assembly protein TadC